MLSKPAFLVLALSILLCLPHTSSIARFVRVLGFFRTRNNAIKQDPGNLIFINDTIQCEDIHFDKKSGKLFLACEDNHEGRFEWFPPLANFQNLSLAAKSTGSIHVVDPESKQSRRLKFTNFSGPFITHGIDVIPDPDSADAAVYIFAINHLPAANTCPNTASYRKCIKKAGSRVEIFRHVIRSDIATHLRSIQHPLISTPNDILTQDSRSFYMTNDHHYREGALQFFKTLYWGTKWSTTIFVKVDSLISPNPAAGIIARVTVGGLYNQNGLSRGRSGEILISCYGSGVLEIGQVSSEDSAIQVITSIRVDSTIDNPSYFSNPYANMTFNASSYLLTGLARAINLPKTATDPDSTDRSIV
ncbi:serum paraoxonase arylesterase [Fusarium pseudocircinatum]|uniref:Serum paraoxonase arylesterase n=1 Tax=Fusarium pseudocircinatum TaxID=56676 RepID=A0A8H5NT82_9HYPO|nr:serum paraoxonase arylesterase [Fusarium pseudocircinatum]